MTTNINLLKIHFETHINPIIQVTVDLHAGQTEWASGVQRYWYCVIPVYHQ